MKGLRAHAHVPIDPQGEADRAHGWACLEDPHDLELTTDKLFFGESVALALRVDTLRPPAAVVRRMVDEGLRALGRRPSRAEKQAFKQEIVRKLRGRAFPVTRAHDVVWLVDVGRLLFWSHGKRPNELLVDLFARSFGLELLPDGPGRQLGGHPAATGVVPTPELLFGFAGMPGRTAHVTEDDDA
jgi:recombination associated protein RdgC